MNNVMGGRSVDGVIRRRSWKLSRNTIVEIKQTVSGQGASSKVDPSAVLAMRGDDARAAGRCMCHLGIINQVLFN